MIINSLHSAVWSPFLIGLIFITGLVILIKTRAFPIKNAKNIFSSHAHSSKLPSAFQSASTALCATMGTGNIIGVAGAVALAGAGVVFWMWVSAIFSMAVKFAEIALSVRYREPDGRGGFLGGAMYYIKNGLPSAFLPLAFLVAFCGLISSFGTGNLTQSNAAVSSLYNFLCAILPQRAPNIYICKLSLGLMCAMLVGAVVFRGEKGIGKFCEKFFPLMTITYLLLCFTTLFLCRDKILPSFALIFKGAFNPECATLGSVASLPFVIKTGVARGMFSNEAGLGTAPIAYSCNDGRPQDLGLWGVFEVFVDTLLVCTLTALTVLCATDISWGEDIPNLTLFALSSVLGKRVIFIFCPVLCFFAFSSIIGWALYGTRFVAFLFGPKFQKPFLIIFCLAIILGAVIKSQTVWIIAETLNGLMAWVCCPAILLLSKTVACLCKK